MGRLNLSISKSAIKVHVNEWNKEIKARKKEIKSITSELDKVNQVKNDLDQNNSKIKSLNDELEQSKSNVAKLTTTCYELQATIRVLLDQSSLTSQETETMQNIESSPPSGQESSSQSHNIKIKENLNSVVNNQIKDKVTITPSQSIITAEVTTSTKDRFKKSRQASDLNWYNQSIMAKKTDTIFQQDDKNWEDVSSGDDLIKPKKKCRRSKVKYSCSKKTNGTTNTVEGEGLYL